MLGWLASSTYPIVLANSLPSLYMIKMNKLEELANLKQGLVKGFITKQDYKRIEKRILLDRN